MSRSEFPEEFIAPNHPVILTSLIEDETLLSRWTLEHLKAACGDVVVEVMSGRNADAQYEINSHLHKTTIRFGDYVELIENGVRTGNAERAQQDGSRSRPKGRPYRRLSPEAQTPTAGRDCQNVHQGQKAAADAARLLGVHPATVLRLMRVRRKL
jgi:hypothetical protein